MRKSSQDPLSHRRPRPTGMLVRLAVLVIFVGPAVGLAQHGPDGGEWQSYAADQGSSKYSPLDQIDKSNVDKLEIVWRWKSVDYGAAKQHRELRAASILETTPLMLSGRVLVNTGLGLASAIDPASGEILWLYNPYEDEDAEPPSLASLGFAITRGGATWKEGQQERLVFVGGGDLVSLDAATGSPDPAFGDDGRVDLRLGLGEPLRGYFWTSPPVVCGDTIVVGNSTIDSSIRQKAPPGAIRGYDRTSGEMLWAFHIIPHEGEFGYDTWQDGSAEYTGHGNVWSWMSCDPELGYIYAPTTTPNNDWYGGHRPGDGLFGESVLCLNARTGERVWHFQAVHHGLWDYDFPAAPILADITVDGRPIKAVVQVSKQAFAYVFDRVTGEPVWPIVELPVPASTVPGEKPSPTQPHPTWPKAYDLQGLKVDDLIDLTPKLRAEALEVIKDYRIGPLFLPPGLEGTDGLKGAVQVPSPVGGSNWNSAAVDPETGILYVPSITVVGIMNLRKPDPARSNLDYTVELARSDAGGYVTLDGGLPITKPPWGRVTAIDLNTGEHLWVAANGDSFRDDPRLAGLDLPPLGQWGRASPLVTKTLLFLADGSSNMIGVPPPHGGRGFRAFDKATGEVVWEMELPAGASGAPMTYMAGGKQYIVVPVSERGYEGELVALALPD